MPADDQSDTASGPAQPSQTEAGPHRTQRQKIANACQRCRRKRVKCSGDDPCQSCVRNASSCIFDQVEKKVTISERELRNLLDIKARYSNLERQGRVVSEQGEEPVARRPQSVSHSNANNTYFTRLQSHHEVNPAAGAPPDLSRLSDYNPLSLSRSFLVIDSSGRQRHPGHSSTWAFSWRVRKLLLESLGENSAEMIPPAEGDGYAMGLGPLNNGSIKVTNIPSRDYSEYLMTTVLFHLGSIYHLFDKEDFRNKLVVIYDNKAAGEGIPTQSEPLLSYLRFLLVIAIGKLLLGRGATELGPPGAGDFLQVMARLPDLSTMYRYQVISIEILCLISLYLQAADMRSVAYNFIGQAQRMALSLGMNREVPPGILDPVECEHRRRIWWTVYIIDRKLSLNVGCPSTIRDEDLNVCLPQGDFRGFSGVGLILHVKLASLTGKVMAAAYALNGSINAAYISSIQQIFSTMTELASDFNGSFALNAGGEISRATATLHLLYYQCTIQATRSIMFILLQRRLKEADGIAHLQPVSESVIALVRTCIGAATTSMKIISMLFEQDLIEPFLPFDLEAVFSSTFILLLAEFVYPSVSAVSEDYMSKADRITNWMRSKGSAPVVSRRKELVEFQKMVTKVKANATGESLIAESTTTTTTANWLWNALNIENGNSDSTLRAMDFDFANYEFVDQMLEGP